MGLKIIREKLGKFQFLQSEEGNTDSNNWCTLTYSNESIYFGECKRLGDGTAVRDGRGVWYTGVVLYESYWTEGNF